MPLGDRNRAASPVASALPNVPANPATVVNAYGLTTVSMAAALVAVPPLLLATTRYCVPVNSTVALLTVNVAVVVPLYGAVSVNDVHDVPPVVDTCHWYVGVGIPAAADVHQAFVPGPTLRLPPYLLIA